MRSAPAASRSSAAVGQACKNCWTRPSTERCPPGARTRRHSSRGNDGRVEVRDDHANGENDQPKPRSAGTARPSSAVARPVLVSEDVVGACALLRATGRRRRRLCAQASDDQVEADGGHGEALVFFDEDQRKRPPGRGLDTPRTSADNEKASSGTANAISWKSNSIICCRPSRTRTRARSRGRDRRRASRGQAGLRRRRTPRPAALVRRATSRRGENADERGNERHDRLK